MQLDYLLRTMRDNFPLIGRPMVLYKASCEDNKAGYTLLERMRFDEANIYEEQDFNINTRNLVDCFRKDLCMFLCDDNVFINRLELQEMLDLSSLLEKNEDIHSLSLRMHPKVTYCYPAKKEMKQPDYDIITGYYNYMRWDWTKAEDQHTCWGYPMAINTHIYRTNDIKEIIERGAFNNVNSLESHINRNRWKDKPLMISPLRPIIFDVCNNYVKDGECGDECLTRKWLDGYQIKNITNIPDNACHGVVNLNLEKRK